MSPACPEKRSGPKRPARALLKAFVNDRGFTAVHCTQGNKLPAQSFVAMYTWLKTCSTRVLDSTGLHRRQVEKNIRKQQEMLRMLRKQEQTLQNGVGWSSNSVHHTPSFLVCRKRQNGLTAGLLKNHDTLFAIRRQKQSTHTSITGRASVVDRAHLQDLSLRCAKRCTRRSLSHPAQPRLADGCPRPCLPPRPP